MTQKLVQPLIEQRLISSSLELRAAGNADSIGIRGYAAKFNTLSYDLGGFTETIAPGAFAKSIADSSLDVILNINHDNEKMLARSSAKTLRLSEDSTGLLVQADMANTSLARDLAAQLRSGDISKMSFAFAAIRDKWDFVNGTEVRTVLEAYLFDVSVVTFPAYENTEVSLRSNDPLGISKLNPEQRKKALQILADRQAPSESLEMRRKRINLKYRNI